MRIIRNAAVIGAILSASTAIAEPLPSADKLTQTFEDASTRSKESAAREFPIEDSPPNPGATPQPIKPPTSKSEKSTDQVIDDLMKQVENLQSKVVVTRKTSLAEQKPTTSKVMGSRTVYSFRDDEIFKVHAGVDRVTDVELQPGEALTNPPVAGDTVRWKIALVKSTRANQESTHVIIKPLDTDIETNVIITTNRRTYHLRVVASDWYMPSVSWNYPQDEELEAQAQALVSERTESVSVSPDSLNFAYEISGDDFPWKPLRVFDDGTKTYLQMPLEMKSHEAPAFFVIEDDDVLLVNYRVKGDFYVVDRLFERAQLRVGTKRIVNVWTKASRPSLFERIF
jgi:P-type conjugative transfer protein TrbG